MSRTHSCVLRPHSWAHENLVLSERQPDPRLLPQEQTFTHGSVERCGSCLAYSSIGSALFPRERERRPDIQAQPTPVVLTYMFQGFPDRKGTESANKRRDAMSRNTVRRQYMRTTAAPSDSISRAPAQLHLHWAGVE